MWTIELPIRVLISKKKFFLINLNMYRNAHFQTLNKAKKVFAEQVSPLLKGIPHMSGCTMEFVLYPGSHRLCDVSNICSVVDKFFCDTLVTCGHLPDDNYNYLTDIRYKFGRVDKMNPRVEVTISPVGETSPIKQNQKEEDMQIILVQAEVEQAIKDYISERLTLSDGTEIQIDLSATRGADGIKATIDLVEGSSPVVEKDKGVSTDQPQKAEAQVKTEEAKSEEPEPVKGDGAEEDKPDAADAVEANEDKEEDKEEEVKPKSLFSNLSKPKNN